jgi:electron transport complex protein RnfA
MGSLFTISEKASADSSLMNAGEYVKFGFKAGIGFIIAALFLTAAYRKLNSSKVPASFRGLPAMLVYIGIISMAVYSLN